MYDQTIVLLGAATDFAVACQACARRREEHEPTYVVHGSLRREADVGWTICPRGHRIRAIRAGRDVHAELTSPLW